MEPIEVSELPFEIIIEILSWLPVEYLLRFKCVCKQWNFLISEDKFIAKHMIRASYVTASMDENFLFCCRCAGLLLEKSKTSRACRIRNPATKQVLDLPDARYGVRQVEFVFNSFTGECKAVCVHDLKMEKLFGVEIINIGKDDKWRSLKIPDQNLLEHGKQEMEQKFVHVDKVGGVLYLPRIIRDGHGLYLQVHSLDMWTECFTTIATPKGLFLDLYKVKTFLWDSRLAVADIAEGSLNILVLEDLKEHKWSRNKYILPLKFLKDNPVWKDLQIDYIIKIHSDGIQFVAGDKHFWNHLKIDKLIELEDIRYKKEVGLKPSLVTLKGMRPERQITLAAEQS